MLLWLAPARDDQLAVIRSDPSAVGRLLHAHEDPDRDVLRWGPRTRLSSGWHVLDFLLRDGGRDPDPARTFLLAGGQRLGDARSHRAEVVPSIAASLDHLEPEALERRFDRARMRAAGVWFYRLSDVVPQTGPDVACRRYEDLRGAVRDAAHRGRALLVAPSRRRTEVSMTVYPTTDEALARYAAEPALLQAHLAEPAAPADRLLAWYPLQIALTELGSTPAHLFLEDGGELVDEALQLRVFAPTEVAALHALFSSLPVEVVVEALDAKVCRREGFEEADRVEVAAGYARLRGDVARHAAGGLGLVTLLAPE